jgi:hypothetical protein
MTDLETRFNQAMFDVYRRAKAEAKYTATDFYEMITSDGGRFTAKRLINSAQPSRGYTELYLRKRLDLTVEAVVVENPQWHPLFVQEEIEKAEKRLRAYGYEPPVVENSGAKTALESPPGFGVRTEAQKAAHDNGYRLDRGEDAG